MKVGVRKGVTMPTGNYESLRLDYSIETEIPADRDPQLALLDQEVFIDELLEKRKAQIKGKQVQHVEQPKPTPQQFSLDADFLDLLPWRLYREGHRSSWIFSNTRGAELLVKAIEEKGTVTIDQFDYRFSGDKKFIARNPAKW